MIETKQLAASQLLFFRTVFVRICNISLLKNVEGYVFTLAEVFFSPQYASFICMTFEAF